MNRSKMFFRIFGASFLMLSFFCNSIGNALGWPAIGLLSDNVHQVSFSYEHGEIHYVLHHHELDLDVNCRDIHDTDYENIKNPHLPGYAVSFEEHHEPDRDHKIHVFGPEDYFRAVKKFGSISRIFVLAFVSFAGQTALKDHLLVTVHHSSSVPLSTGLLKTLILRI